MTVNIKCALAVNQLFASRQCVHRMWSRHYPRWTHRRPVVKNEIQKEPLDQWKLRVEREIVRSSFDKTVKVKPLLFDPNEGQTSVSKRLMSENDNTAKSNTESDSNQCSSRLIDSKDYLMNGKIVQDGYDTAHYKENTRALKSAKKSLDELSSKSDKKECKLNSSQEVIVKRKIYNERELAKALKLQKSASELGVPVFQDLGTDDTILSSFLTDVKSQSGRAKRGLILLEGKRIIKDAVEAGIVPKAVFFSRIKDLCELNLPHKGIKIYKLIYKKLCLWSDLTTPPGVLGIAKIPDVRKEGNALLPLTVICDNIRDPGNLGVILRTCAGVGCREVILTKGCVDMWEPKVLRAGAGAHFRIKVSQRENWNSIAEKTGQDSCVCIARNNMTDNETSDLGGEIDGINRTDLDNSDVGNHCRFSSTKEIFSVPIIPYFAMDYSSLSSLVFIIGGETEGVSSHAYKFASESNGVCVNIPLSNNVESLNSGTALGIIAFEMKKQFLTKLATTKMKVEKKN